MDLEHSIDGINSEAGELIDELKKAKYYPGHELDVTNIKEEFGDLLFYFMLGLNHFGWTLREIMDMNRAKLDGVRYKDGFSGEAALNRDLDAEREALEKHT